MNAYIFILCPPYSGSTILWRLISTSSSVSSLPSEGQFLPEVTKLMRQDPWNPEVKLPWQRIKEVWDGYWDQNKPLLVEKSPPNLIRTEEILTHFNPIYFLIMVRNPYAHCEGLIRRNNWDAQKAAEFTVRCMKQQAKNADELSNSLCFTYEEFTENLEFISRKIQSFIPGIGALKHSDTFRVHSIDGNIERSITNLNQKTIENLSMLELAQINKVLKENTEIMTYWGYEYYIPSLSHKFVFFRKRISSLLSKSRQV